MRVAERVAKSRDTRTPGARRFTEALGDARRGARKALPDAVAGRAAERSTSGARRAHADRTSAELRERREGFGEAEQRQAPTPASAMTVGQPASPSHVEAAPELRAIVRTLPVAIEAARVREGEPLSLSLGRALSVELRRGVGGLEVVLRPDPTLQRAAAAELPGLLASLRARGIAVARAEVRAQANGDPAARRPAR